MATLLHFYFIFYFVGYRKISKYYSAVPQVADSLGERYAQERGLAIERHPADWNAHGRAAGPIRNEEMAATADALIAFPLEGQQNRGTYNMIALAKEHGLLVRVVR